MTFASLADYQDAFAAALLPGEAADLAPELRALARQPGFAVYRNTVMTGCLDALQANFPAVERLVGEAWFRAAARVYAQRNLPEAPALLLYGDAFPAFLEAFAPARDLPYLHAVARVDRLWSEAHVAADAPSLDPAVLGHLPPADIGRIALQPHPAARWLWNDDWPVRTLWSRNRAEDACSCEGIAWIGEGVLLSRPDEAVLVTALGRGGARLLDACAAGAAIGDAVAAALAAAPGTDLAGLIADLLRAGAFSRVVPARTSRQEPTNVAKESR